MQEAVPGNHERGEANTPSRPREGDGPQRVPTSLSTAEIDGSSSADDSWNTLSVDEAQRRPPPVAELIRLTAPDEGSVYTLFEGNNQVGTRGDAEVLLTDRTISNPHALILCQPRHDGYGYEINDQRSKNGTFVDEKRVQRSDLKDGSKIRFANVEFRLKTLRRN